MFPPRARFFRVHHLRAPLIAPPRRSALLDTRARRPLVLAHGLPGDRALARPELEHLVDQEKGLAVGKDLLDRFPAERRRDGHRPMITRRPRACPAADCGPGARSTSPFRRASWLQRR